MVMGKGMMMTWYIRVQRSSCKHWRKNSSVRKFEYSQWFATTMTTVMTIMMVPSWYFSTGVGVKFSNWSNLLTLNLEDYTFLCAKFRNTIPNIKCIIQNTIYNIQKYHTYYPKYKIHKIPADNKYINYINWYINILIDIFGWIIITVQWKRPSTLHQLKIY